MDLVTLTRFDSISANLNQLVNSHPNLANLDSVQLHITTKNGSGSEVITLLSSNSPNASSRPISDAGAQASQHLPVPQPVTQLSTADCQLLSRHEDQHVNKIIDLSELTLAVPSTASPALTATPSPLFFTSPIEYSLVSPLSSSNMLAQVGNSSKALVPAKPFAGLGPAAISSSSATKCLHPRVRPPLHAVSNSLVSVVRNVLYITARGSLAAYGVRLAFVLIPALLRSRLKPSALWKIFTSSRIWLAPWRYAAFGGSFLGIFHALRHLLLYQPVWQGSLDEVKENSSEDDDDVALDSASGEENNGDKNTKTKALPLSTISSMACSVLPQSWHSVIQTQDATIQRFFSHIRVRFRRISAIISPFLPRASSYYQRIFISAAIAGSVSLCWLPESTQLPVTIFFFVRAAEIFTRIAAASHLIPSIPFPYPTVFGASTAFITFCWIFAPGAIDAGYRGFLNTHCGNRWGSQQTLAYLHHGVAIPSTYEQGVAYGYTPLPKNIAPSPLLSNEPSFSRSLMADIVSPSKSLSLPSPSTSFQSSPVSQLFPDFLHLKGSPSGTTPGSIAPPLIPPSLLGAVNAWHNSLNLHPFEKMRPEDFSSRHKMTCAVLHPHDPTSCVRGIAMAYPATLTRALKTYLPIYLLPALLFRSSSLLAAPGSWLQHVLLSALRSAVFLSNMSAGSYFFTCMFRPLCSPAMKFHSSFMPLCTGLAAFLAILGEDSNKCSELALFSLSRAIDSCIALLGQMTGISPSFNPYAVLRDNNYNYLYGGAQGVENALMNQHTSEHPTIQTESNTSGAPSSVSTLHYALSMTPSRAQRYRSSTWQQNSLVALVLKSICPIVFGLSCGVIVSALLAQPSMLRRLYRTLLRWFIWPETVVQDNDSVHLITSTADAVVTAESDVIAVTNNAKDDVEGAIVQNNAE